MNKIIVIGVISAIIIGIVILYTAYQNSPTTNNQQIPVKSQTQNTPINSTVTQPIGNDTHRVVHITLNDGIGVQIH